MSFLLITAQMTHSAPLALTCLVITVASGGFAAYSVNLLDLAPQYASLTLGVSNTIATLPGLISPTITGYIVQHKACKMMRFTKPSINWRSQQSVL